MKTCISKIICLISSIIYLWRTSHKYACRNCKHKTNQCHGCMVLRSCRTISELHDVGVPTKWQGTDK